MKVKTIDTTYTHFQGEVGTPMQLEIEGFDERLQSFLVGILPEEFLILKLPRLGAYVGQPKHVDLGAAILVRYVHRGTVWGFRSQVKRVVSTPSGLLLIDIPENLEIYDLRQEERIDCLLPSKIVVGKKSRRGTVVDLSKKGCRILIELEQNKKAPKIEIDDELEFVCSLPGVEGEQALNGRVRQIQQDARGITLGLQFINLEDRLESVIAQYIEAVMSN